MTETEITAEHGKRTWSGGGYEGREGIEIQADVNGITIGGWYDGGVGLDFRAKLTWDELAELQGEGEGQT